MSEQQTPWWWPTLVDEKTVARLRSSYPEETEGLDDECVLSKYECDSKYETTWDHTGDAYDQFELLADAFLEMRNEVASVLMLMDGLAEQWGDEGVFRRCRDRLRKLVSEPERTDE